MQPRFPCFVLHLQEVTFMVLSPHHYNDDHNEIKTGCFNENGCRKE